MQIISTQAVLFIYFCTGIISLPYYFLLWRNANATIALAGLLATSLALAGNICGWLAYTLDNEALWLAFTLTWPPTWALIAYGFASFVDPKTSAWRFAPFAVILCVWGLVETLALGRDVTLVHRNDLAAMVYLGSCLVSLRRLDPAAHSGGRVLAALLLGILAALAALRSGLTLAEIDIRPLPFPVSAPGQAIFAVFGVIVMMMMPATIHVLHSERDQSRLRRLGSRLAEQSEGLNEALEFNRKVVEGAPIGIIAFHADGRCVLVNPAAAAIVGGSREAIKALNFRDIASWRENGVVEIADRALTTGASQGFQGEFTTTFGRRLFLDMHFVVVTADGEPHLLTMIQDHTRRQRSEEELNRARIAAESANQAKSAFLATMSHEVRTPMNAIIGLAQLLKKTNLNDKQHGYLDRIADSAVLLLNVLNDILDFSKIEAGMLRIDKVEFPLARVVDNVNGLMAVQADAKHLEFLVEIDPAIPAALLGDPLRLGQILLNLLSNAIKFTASGEVGLTVALTARGADTVELAFGVRDTGIGLEAGQARTLFQPYSQADTSTARRFGGTGLGLAISKQLTEAMGGTITVDSQPGQGSLFTVSLTLGVAAGTLGAAVPAPPAGFHGLKVLVADDNASQRRLLAGILTSWGVRAETAAGGEEAIGAVERAAGQSQPFDAILLDWRMPGMDGIAVVEALKRARALARIPCVLLVTGFDREEVLRRTEAPDVAGYLTKPIRPAALAETLDEILGRPPAPTPSPVELETGAAEERARRLAPLAGRRVLVVEDNEINRLVATELLADLGLEVETASDGRQAVDRLDTADPRLAERPIDIVLMDVQMPILDGLAATRLLRANPRFATLPIIAMTANAMTGDREKSLEAGMNDHVVKPIAIDDLGPALTRWLARAAAQATHLDEATSSAALVETLPDVAGIDRALALTRSEGNAGRVRRLWARARDEFAGQRRTIPAHIEAGRLFDAHCAAHSLKSAAAQVGAVTLSQAAASLEAVTLAERPGDINTPLIALLAELDRVVAGLDAIGETVRG